MEYNQNIMGCVLMWRWELWGQIHLATQTSGSAQECWWRCNETLIVSKHLARIISGPQHVTTGDMWGAGTHEKWRQKHQQAISWPITIYMTARSDEFVTRNYVLHILCLLFLTLYNLVVMSGAKYASRPEPQSEIMRNVTFYNSHVCSLLWN